MATLLSKDQVKFLKLNSDFSNDFFSSCHRLLKTYSPSAHFEDELKLYVFESLKLKQKFNLKKKVLQCLKFGLQGGKFGCYALCDPIYTCF